MKDQKTEFEATVVLEGEEKYDDFIIKEIKKNPKITQMDLTEAFNEKFKGELKKKRAQSTIGKRIKDLGYIKTDKGYVKKSTIRRKHLLTAIKSLMKYTTITIISVSESETQPYIELKIKDDSLTTTLNTLFAKYYSSSIQYATYGYKYLKLTFSDMNGYNRFMQKFEEYTTSRYTVDNRTSEDEVALDARYEEESDDLDDEN